MLSMTSDYRTDAECPQPYLRRIAEAGFTHIHWCHHWSTDFLYGQSEIEQIAQWLQELGLAVTDVHASAGREKGWTSQREYERLAGVELVINRIAMAARLGSDVVILHLPSTTAGEAEADVSARWDRIWRSLDALQAPAAEHGVRIAFENGNFHDIEKILDRHDKSYVGLCYDSGHGNLIPDGLDRLEGLKGRLISIHLHDNDGRDDLHGIPLTGTVDWERLCGILAGSSYEKWISQEATMRHADSDDEEAFLAQARRAGQKLAKMLEQHIE